MSFTDTSFPPTSEQRSLPISPGPAMIAESRYSTTVTASPTRLERPHGHEGGTGISAHFALWPDERASRDADGPALADIETGRLTNAQVLSRVQSEIVMLPHIPKNPVGKIDKPALRRHLADSATV